MDDDVEQSAPERKGRYILYDRIAAGGMATVHLGRLVGAGGFGRTVAIKRLHPHLSTDRDFAAMLLDEARIAARLRHPNVVHTIDVVDSEGEVLLVMEYVHGVSLSSLVRGAAEKGERVPSDIAARIICDLLRGLHAAHEAVDERGIALGIVHRDVSPQNVLVGADGVSRVVDFGIAKAAGRLQQTDDGKVKGKLSYMSPEQLGGGALDRRSDVYAASIVLWEALTGESLFGNPGGDINVQKVMQHVPEPPSKVVPGLTAAFDEVVLRGLRREARQRFATARDMAVALEQCGRLATPLEVAAWVEEAATDVLVGLAAQVARVERADADLSGGTLIPAGNIELATETVSSVDASATSYRPRYSRAPMAIAAIALVALAGAVTFVIAPIPSSSRSAETAVAPGPVAPSAAAQPEDPLLTTGEIVIDTPTADAGATSAGNLPPTGGRAGAAVRPRPAPRRIKKPCPQYEIDADGVKHYNVPCL